MKKVIIGMSGGVDSSVAAILLLEQGYEVEGLFMRNWDSSINNDILGNPDLNNNICPQEQDYNDAVEVCKKLNIKLHRIDFVKEYWDHVFKYFLDELEKGRTPNPDIYCNKYIKFDYFVKEAKRLGADYIATGHYARLEDGKLKKAIDSNKDQTYFLSFLSEEQLKDVLFPLGDIKKEEVREIALKYDLITAKKKDSTGICFIGERNFKDFLKNYLPSKKGDIINIDNMEKVGEHSGLMYYTIGQRKGLNIGGNESRLFVVGKDLDKNVLYVSLNDTKDYLISDSALLEEISFNTELRPSKCKAKFRYRAPEYDIGLEYLNNNEIIVRYDSIRSVTPGQICAFYLDDMCIGGGVIKEVRKDNEKLWYLL